MSDAGNQAHLRALGARILSEANDLKRTPEALARELGMELSLVRAVMDGTADLAAGRSVAQAMADYYPVSLGDLWVDADDTDHGVRLMSAAESERTSRVFDRRDRGGGTSAYYEYRDTAMSRTAPFKPEWIKPLRVVDDADPEHPDVAYNNGHLLHQATFFVGPVDFHWQSGGRRHVARLDTGDSNYITPFMPHSFTAPDPGCSGFIIAVTFAGQVRNALAEFGRMDAEAVARFAGDLRDADGFAVRLRRHLAAETLDEASFTAMAADAGLKRDRAADLLAGAAPTMDEVTLIAELLGIRPADLMVARMTADEEVVVRRRDPAECRDYPSGNDPAYRLARLAQSRHQPLLKGFDIEILGGGNGELSHSLHEYVFNYGGAPVDLVWDGDRRATLAPGDSAYVRPLVAHRFERPGGAEPGRLAMIRVPGMLTDPVLDEFASYAPEGRARVVEETLQWF